MIYILPRNLPLSLSLSLSLAGKKKKKERISTHTLVSIYSERKCTSRIYYHTTLDVHTYHTDME